MQAFQLEDGDETVVKHRMYGERRWKTSTAPPYFYVDHDEGYSLPARIDGWVERDIDLRAYDGTRLDRVVLRSTRDMTGDKDKPGARDVADNHFEADIPFERRFYIDEVERGFRDERPSILHVDIETESDSGLPDAMDPQDRVVSIACYADKHDRHFDLLLEPEGYSLRGAGHGIERDEKGRTYIEPEWAAGDGADDGSERVYVFKEERDLLNAFATVVRRSDTEVLTGWNFEDFDAAYLVNRMAEVDGCDQDDLSELGESYTSSWTNANGKRQINVTIKGVDVFDMMVAYKRQKRRDNPPNWRLGTVARHEGLEAQKIPFDTSRMGEEWRADPVAVMEYNRRDAYLTYLLDQKLETFDEFLTFHRELAVPLPDTTKNSVLVEMYVMSKAPEWDIPNNERILDSKTQNENDFEGGRTEPPKKGAYRNVFSVDVTSEYPNWIRAANLSKETVVLPGDPRWGDPDNIRSPEMEKGKRVEFLPHDERLGILPRAVDDIMRLKETQTELRDQHSVGSSQWELHDGKRTTAKELANSLQGVSGMETHRLSSNEVAATITALGRETVGFMKRVGETEGHRFIYGDTDSAFFDNPRDVRSPDAAVAAAKDLASAVNGGIAEWAREAFNIVDRRREHLEVEPDKVARRALFPRKKKRYTLWLYWKDGDHYDKISHTGWATVRSDSSEVEDKVQQKALEAVIHNKSESYVNDKVRAEMRRVMEGDYEPHQLARAVGCQRPFESYGDNPGTLDFENVPYFVSAMVSSNELLGTDYRGGDKAYMLPVTADKSVERNGSTNRVNYLAIDDDTDLPGWARINYSKVLGGIVKKLNLIYDAVGWDLDPLRDTKSAMVREAAAEHTASQHQTLETFL